MTGTEKITRFVDDYEIRPDRRQLQPPERELLREALEDYICHEQWHEPAADDVAGIARIDKALASGDGDGHAALLATARSLIVDLTARLARREDANHIMREHLAMMSDKLWRLEQKVAGMNETNAQSST